MAHPLGSLDLGRSNGQFSGSGLKASYGASNGNQRLVGQGRSRPSVGAARAGHCTVDCWGNRDKIRSTGPSAGARRKAVAAVIADR